MFRVSSVDMEVMNGLDHPDMFGLREKPNIVEDRDKKRQRRNNPEEPESPKDLLYEDMKPVIVTLFVLGFLPITRANTGMFRFKFVSLAMFYSVCLYVVVVVSLGFTHYNEFRDMNTQNIDEAVPLITFMMQELIVFVFPFFYWAEARAIGGYLSHWARYQTEFFTVTGQRLRLNLFRRSVILTVFLPILCVGLDLLYSFENNNFFPPLILTSVYQDLVTIFVMVFWHLLCKAHVSTSKRLMFAFKKEMSDSGAHRVAEYRLAWLHLSHLARGLGDAACYTYGFYVSYLFLTLILSVYLAVTSLNKILYYHVDLLDSVVLGVCLFLVCDGSTQVANQVGESWKTYLLSLKTCPDEDIRRQLDEFLMTCNLHQPIMTLGDYVRVDRALLVSFVSTMVTYLVVMIQFKMANISGGSLPNPLPKNSTIPRPK